MQDGGLSYVVTSVVLGVIYSNVVYDYVYDSTVCDSNLQVKVCYK